ncbi:MAG: hydrolase [Bacteroidetes bacterium]|nr:hydrolase [Bacteroidota bacterium]
MTKRFNVRIYGILIKNNKVLVSDEFIKGHHITKFPGGGLEFGEGSKDCVLREFKEELDLDIQVQDHFYTTDFFVHSAFDTNSQVISIYYLVTTEQPLSFKTSDKTFDYEKKEGAQSLRWIDIKKISDNDFTLIIDKKVGELLQKKFQK